MISRVTHFNFSLNLILTDPVRSCRGETLDNLAGRIQKSGVGQQFAGIENQPVLVVVRKTLGNIGTQSLVDVIQRRQTVLRAEMPHSDNLIGQQAIIPFSGTHDDDLTARQPRGGPARQKIPQIRHRDDLTTKVGDSQQPALDARHPSNVGNRDDFGHIVHGE